MKGINTTKLFLLHPLHKQGNGSSASLGSLGVGSHHRLWVMAFVSFFTFVSLVTLLTTTATTGGIPKLPSSTATAAARPAPLPAHVFETLLHYASHSNATGRMSDDDLRLIAAVLRRRAPCNLLVFGLSHETPLWRALNGGGRTVFLDENEYYIAHLEGRHPGLEGYDVGYTTKVGQLRGLIASARKEVRGECRPVQNLLFSDCRLAINDLPNELYDVAWDVILVDGPRGYESKSPGRMSAIFTAAVMARWRNGGPTDVLVHDYEREVERVCSEEFLCGENMVANTGQLAHFVVRGGAAVPGGGFCANRSATSSAAVSQ